MPLPLPLENRDKKYLKNIIGLSTCLNHKLDFALSLQPGVANNNSKIFYLDKMLIIGEKLNEEGRLF